MSAAASYSRAEVASTTSTYRVSGMPLPVSRATAHFDKPETAVTYLSVPRSWLRDMMKTEDQEPEEGKTAFREASLQPHGDEVIEITLDMKTDGPGAFGFGLRRLAGCRFT